ncbi:MAG: isoprenylcysteine carboxylmethyltransferase family protein [Deltaproteobacteria bacterium]|jgi:protein-S-isoprenylcysteine O-methyltransferase Ste14|nr:isoprenylcysteine carboxylmethyltransferase family protein [Deltaproteobacteria bacterium]
MQAKKGEHPLGDAGQLILFFMFLITWILDSFVLHRSTFLAGLIPLVIRLFLLITLLAAAFFLFKSGHVAVIGEQRPARILSTGAFGYVRHPLYLGSILVYLGLTVSTASLFCLALLVVIVLFYNSIADYEEKLMEAKFGQAYIAYREQTGRWIPRFGKKPSQK